MQDKLAFAVTMLFFVALALLSTALMAILTSAFNPFVQAIVLGFWIAKAITMGADIVTLARK